MLLVEFQTTFFDLHSLQLKSDRQYLHQNFIFCNHAEAAA